MKNTEYSPEPGQRERRRWQRHNIYLPASLTGMDKDGQIVLEPAMTLNVSARGAFLLCRGEFEPGVELDIVIRPSPGLDISHHVRAKVVRVERDMHGFSKSQGRGVGVLFSRRMRFLNELERSLNTFPEMLNDGEDGPGASHAGPSQPWFERSDQEPSTTLNGQPQQGE
jgi:hypothetical protein